MHACIVWHFAGSFWPHVLGANSRGHLTRTTFPPALTLKSMFFNRTNIPWYMYKRLREMENLTPTEPTTPSEQPSLPNQAQTRPVNASNHRRSTNACRRCKRRKIKCYHNSEGSNSKCVPCSKAHSECLFDVPPDGVLKSHAYVATLEARIQTLESQLRAKNSEEARKRNQPSFTSNEAFSESHVHEREGQLHERGNLSQENVASPLLSLPISKSLTVSQDPGKTASSQCSTQRGQVPGAPIGSPSEQQTSSSDITVLDMLHNRAFTSDLEGDALPALPSSNRAKELVDTVYFYTQARYCIIDWTQLREWHLDREAIAYTSPEGPVAAQTGAFFIWIIYAIGACLVPNSENSTEVYFARARVYLPAIIALQNLATVQALLCVTQYYFRAANESPIWDLVGVVLRLCIKLRYHRKAASLPDVQSLDPYTVELQKRFFWCAYCFDRLISMLSKLPFGIGDSDIDIETPVDIDDTCTDWQKIRELQMKQAAGEASHREGVITTMTAALHHLQVYRIRSRILTNFTGPHAQVPSLTDVERILSELDQWRQQAPRKHNSRSFPQQNPDRVQANYLQAVLLLIRPILTGSEMNSDLIGLCVEFAADACESAKVLSLNPLTCPDRITVYHCFYAGITLLQCLAINPTALTPRSAHQAISSCLSALAVYTRVLPAVAPFLRLFENVSNLFVRDNHDSGIHPSPKVRDLLNRIISSDPSETSGILNSLSHQESQQPTSAPTPEALEGDAMANQYDSILGGQSSVVPLEMPLDISPLYAPDAEMMDLWTASWLDPSSTEFS